MSIVTNAQAVCRLFRVLRGYAIRERKRYNERYCLRGVACSNRGCYVRVMARMSARESAAYRREKVTMAQQAQQGDAIVAAQDTPVPRNTPPSCLPAVILHAWSRHAAFVLLSSFHA